MLQEFRSQKIIWTHANQKIPNIITSDGDERGRTIEVEIKDKDDFVDLAGVGLYLDTPNETFAFQYENGVYWLYVPSVIVSNFQKCKVGLRLEGPDFRVNSKPFYIKILKGVVKC